MYIIMASDKEGGGGLNEGLTVPIPSPPSPPQHLLAIL